MEGYLGNFTSVNEIGADEGGGTRKKMVETVERRCLFMRRLKKGVCIYFFWGQMCPLGF